MEIKGKNFARTQPKFNDGDVVVRCNLSQETPETEIAIDVKGLIFERCNLVNCKLPGDVVTKDCNMRQVVLEDIHEPTEVELLIEQINVLPEAERIQVRAGIVIEERN